MTDLPAKRTSGDAKKSAQNGDFAPRNLSPLKRLIPFVTRYPTRLVLTFVFLFVATIAQLAVPALLGGVIDEGFVAKNLDRVGDYVWLIFGVAGVLGIASGARFYFISVIGERVVADLRLALFRHLLRLDVAFYDRNRVGELTSRLNTDTSHIRSAIGTSLTLALRSLVTIFGSVVMMFLTSTLLAGIVVIAVPAIVFPILFFARRLRRMSRRTQDAMADISAMATEVLSAPRTIKSFVQEKAQHAIFSERSEASFQAEVTRLAARAVLVAVVFFLGTGALVVMIWWGAQQVFAGNVTVGQLTQFLVYAMMAATALTNVSEVWGSLQAVAGSTERLFEILDTMPELEIVDAPIALPTPSQGIVELDHVSFAYAGREGGPILDDVNLKVGSGETVALVGASGAGKSTIFALLQRFYDVGTGAIRVDGCDIRQVHPDDLRHRFAYVEQDSIIFAGTIADNIRFGKPDASRDEIEAAAKAALVDEFVQQFESGYDTIVGERGVMLSGGQRQRLAIARALLKDAPILLLDEATSALDAQSEHLVQRALEHLMKGRTTLVIAHRLATIRNADRILVLDDGRIIDEGTHDELVTKGGRYAELAKLQFKDMSEVEA